MSLICDAGSVRLQEMFYALPISVLLHRSCRHISYKVGEGSDETALVWQTHGEDLRSPQEEG